MSGSRRQRLLFCFVSFLFAALFLLLVTDVVYTEGSAEESHLTRRLTRENEIKKLHMVFKSLTKGKSTEETVRSSSVKMAATDNQFNAQRVLNLFTACRAEDDTLTTDCYVDGYEELCKLFRLFGKIFSFVAADVEEKFGILREYRKSAEGEEYETFQKMLQYEIGKDITDNKKKPSGARTLLRLHRALEFISALLVKLRDTENQSKFSSVAVQVYTDTLAKHHPWLIKKGATFAMKMLDSREDLLKKMNVEDTEEGRAGLKNLTDELDKIYAITQHLYDKDNLNKLP